MNNSTSLNFPITVYGNLEKITNVLSVGRCRIFYKYGNRNGSYITEDFAEKLIATLPYAPVKGIYLEDCEDYSDHGERRDLGRIYGIVPGPQDMGFAWEKHLDEDGVEREYACVNVYYYTALYKEANEICGKGLSMELYGKSVEGDWKVIDGKKYFVYEKGSFLGLQVLGDDVEPCFEGANFFSLYETVKDLYQRLEQYQNNFQNYGEGGEPEMTENINDLIPEEVESLETTDESVDVSTLESEPSVIEEKKEESPEASQDFQVELAQANETINNLKAEISIEKEKNSEFGMKIAEFENEIATLMTDRDAIQTLYNAALQQIETLQQSCEALTAERNELAIYKKDILDKEKRTLINTYSDVVAQEDLQEYLDNLDKYTLRQLDMELTYKQKMSHPEVFSKNSSGATYIPKDVSAPKNSLENLLSKYERK